MPAGSKRKTKRLTATAAELAVAVPQVVAHRVARMAMAGPALCERDHKEFQRMGAEKADAWRESWGAMAAQALRSNHALTASFVKLLWSPSLAGKPSPAVLAAQLHNAALDVLGKGMARVHQRAVANARRLARTKLR